MVILKKPRGGNVYTGMHELSIDAKKCFIKNNAWSPHCTTGLISDKAKIHIYIWLCSDTMAN